MDKKLNIIPIIKNSKKPSVKWLEYQNKTFPNNDLHLYEPCNYAVICGKTSNNLVIIDFDFKNKPLFRNILNSLKTNFPDDAKTMIVTTPNGLHIYFFILGICPTRQTQICSPFEEVAHVDILGEGGYALIPPSMIGDKCYLSINDYKIKTIIREKFDEIIASFTTTEEIKEKITLARARKKPLSIKRFRTPFQWILLGNISIKRTSQQTGKEPLIYWRGLYAETISLGYEPKDLFPILAEKQSDSFDIKKAKYQVEYAEANGNLDKPLTNRMLKVLFPTYTGIERDAWVEIAEELEAQFDVAVMSDSKKLMIKEGNIYTYKTNDFFKELDHKLLERTLGKRHTHYKTQVLSHFMDANRFDRDNYCYDENIIPFLNGYYDIKSGKFVKAENTKKVFCYVIPHQWKRGHYDCPNFMRLLGEWLYDNGKITEDDMFEMIGYTMSMDTGQRKAFFILGPTTTGKTSFQNILETVVGKDNRIATAIQDFGESRFSTDNMENKVLCMVGDMGASVIDDTSYFKMVTGDDTHLPAEVKGGAKYMFKNITKIWYNANSLPILKKKGDDAFYIRWILMHFKNKFPTDVAGAKKKIYRIITEDEDEIQGVLHKAMKGAKRLYERGWFRPELAKHTEHVWNYYSDHIYAFIYDNCIIGDSEMVPAMEFQNAYNRWSFRRHKERLTPYKIKEALEAHGIFKERSSTEDEYGKRGEYYDGISWKSEEKELEVKRF